MEKGYGTLAERQKELLVEGLKRIPATTTFYFVPRRNEMRGTARIVSIFAVKNDKIISFDAVFSKLFGYQLLPTGGIILTNVTGTDTGKFLLKQLSKTVLHRETAYKAVWL